MYQYQSGLQCFGICNEHEIMSMIGNLDERLVTVLLDSDDRFESLMTSHNRDYILKVSHCKRKKNQLEGLSFM